MPAQQVRSALLSEARNGPGPGGPVPRSGNKPRARSGFFLNGLPGSRLMPDKAGHAAGQGACSCRC